MNKDIKMAIIDGTDIMIIGGYGNVSGNLNLLKYSNNEIEEMIKENNIEKDNIRLIQSLLKTIKWQKHQLEEKDKIINNIRLFLKENKSYEYESEETSYLDHESLLELKEILERGKNGKS